jgi:hypothetical protein
MKLGLTYRVDERIVLIGDGVKQSKEARHMPGIKKLHQESENSSKREYMYGHMFGGIGVLLGTAGRKLYCVMVSMKLHDGIKVINGWDKDGDYEECSHVVQTIKDAGNAAKILGSSILLLDRLYLTRPMLKTLVNERLLHVVTKAKSNATAYLNPEPKTGPGAKPKKGEKVSVMEYLRRKDFTFTEDSVYVYGKLQRVEYNTADLLWGKGLYQRLRFVRTVLDGKETVLVSTDLTLTPVQIIELYSYRFKIERSFRELKQVVAGFSYRFWSKHMPKLNRYLNNEKNQESLRAVADEKAQANIISCVNAIEGHALIGCIALGLLQMISLRFASAFLNTKIRFMRTQSSEIPSEATVADYMRKNIYLMFRFFSDLPIIAFITKRQSSSVYDWRDTAA